MKLAIGALLLLGLLATACGGGTAGSAILPAFKTPTPISETAALTQLEAKIREAGLKHSAFGCVYWYDYGQDFWSAQTIGTGLPASTPVVEGRSYLPANYDPRIMWRIYDQWAGWNAGGTAPYFIVIYDETAPPIHSDLARYDGDRRTCLVPQ